MSLLDSIKNKKKHLKNTETIITRSDGSTYKENTDMRSLGLEPVKINNAYIKYGFVVDLKPDCIPANIIPGLYIGSQDCADESILEKYQITHILSIGVDSSISHLQKKYVPCLDIPETSINEILKDTCPYIKEVLDKNLSIIVHCNAGVSRSSMIIIGYLILELKYSFDEAYNLTKSKRPCIQPNAGFLKQLRLL